MSDYEGDFLFSSEQELQTTVAGDGDVGLICEASMLFMRKLGRLAPSVPGHPGMFNAYGRVYVDCGHIELAMMECDDPYLLVQVLDCQQRLVQQAAKQAAEDGVEIRLSNNNHSGLLQRHAPIWGAHENYLVEQPPPQFGERILPFLVTRFYAGSGGVTYPKGDYLAGVRHQFMRTDCGGGTTEYRAIHSTSRQEHHMGEDSHRFRYHLILADGHRSHFNWALQFGATALALKAILYDEKAAKRAYEACRIPLNNSWTTTLKRFNKLASVRGSLRVEPRAVKVQQVYLDAARQFVDRMEQPPSWAARILDDWQDVLDATRRRDDDWLAARLDAFAKYKLFSGYLDNAGHHWRNLARTPHLFSELALLDHDYHNLSHADSVFQHLERVGLLQHRVVETPAPGEESEAFVPDTRTRARARARFICQNAHRRDLTVDWSWVHDRAGKSWLCLFDPFATDFDSWTPAPSDSSEEPRRRRPIRSSAVAELTERIRLTAVDNDNSIPF